MISDETMGLLPGMVLCSKKQVTLRVLVRGRRECPSRCPDGERIFWRIPWVLMFVGARCRRKRCPACAVHTPTDALARSVDEKLSAAWTKQARIPGR